MPRDKKNEDITSRNNRYIPFRPRRLQLETMPTTSESKDQQGSCYIRRCPVNAEKPMMLFHAQVVERLNSILNRKELELASDAETLTADETSSSDNSNDSWTSDESSHGAMLPFADVYPRVVVFPMPRLEPMEEPMEIVTDEENTDDSTETSSFWSSDDDEEIQRACQQDSSDEEESDEEDDSNGAEPGSGRVNRPQLVYQSAEFPPSPPVAEHPLQSYSPVGHWESSPGYHQEVQAQSGESFVELMEYDHESSFEEASSLNEPPRSVIGYDSQTQFHLVYGEYGYERSIHGNGREIDYYYPRYGLHLGADCSNVNNNDYPLDEAFLSNPASWCNHCGSAIHPRQEYPANFVARASATDFSIRHLLSSDRNCQN